MLVSATISNWIWKNLRRTQFQKRFACGIEISQIYDPAKSGLIGSNMKRYYGVLTK